VVFVHRDVAKGVYTYDVWSAAAMWCSWLLLFTVELGAVANEGDEVFHPSRHGQKHTRFLLLMDELLHQLG